MRIFHPSPLPHKLHPIPPHGTVQTTCRMHADLKGATPEFCDWTRITSWAKKMKWFVVILNVIAAVIMFGSLVLVPYVDLTGLRTEAAQMDKGGVFKQDHLDSYLNRHNAMAGRLNRYDALGCYLYGMTPAARPFLRGACIAFLANAVLIGVFWRRHPKKEG